MTAKAIAIDGPAGAGKSTVAKILAKRLSYLYIDTGAMYRAVAWKALQNGISVDDDSALTKIAREIEIRLVDGEAGYQVFCDKVDVSDAIRKPQVGAAASPISAVAGVREALVAQQQRMAQAGNVVMDGRDIGTKVLPQAECKVFLTACPEVRAQRRLQDLLVKGIDTTLEEVFAEIQERDHRDSTRTNSPLIVADGATVVDSSEMTIEEVVDKIYALAGAK